MKIRYQSTGMLAIVVGGLALVGWATDIAVLKSILPGWVSMKPNTALAFMLMGSALLLHTRQPVSAGPRRLPWASSVSSACALLAGLIGLLTLCEYAFGWNPGLDLWLFKEPAGTVGTSNPGRMAPDSALSFVLLALARLAGSWRFIRRNQVVSVTAGSLVTTLAFVEIVSYFTPILRTYGWGGLTMMALPTATLFAVLGLAIVFGSWREALSPRLAAFSNHLWWLAGSIAILTISFALYVRSEKQISQVHEQRHRSLLFADSLRQSSDDLMRMARTYAVTGDPIYRQYFQDVLDIQNGTKPWPGPHWRPELTPGKESGPHDRGEAAPLLELMRLARFNEAELRLMAEAKANSDALTILECEALKLFESTGPGAEVSRARARTMLFDARYLQARSAVLRPIQAFQEQVDRRTLKDVRAAENSATIFRYLLLAFGLGLVFVLWRTYHALGNILGGPVDEVYSTLTRIGGGDFSKAVQVKPGLANSVLGWLSETQTRLSGIERERQQADDAMRASEQRFRTASVESPFPLMIHAEDGEVVAISRAWTDLSGYTHSDIPTIAEWTHKAYGFHRQAVVEEIETLYNLEHRKAEGEYLITCKDGTQRTWDFSSVSLGRMSDGRRIAMSMAFDVTERKQTIDALRLSEERFRMVAQTANDVVYEWDLKQEVHWLGKIDEMLGYEPGEFPSTLDGWAASLHPEDAQRTMVAIQTHLDERVPYAVEYRVRRKDGDYCWWSARGAAARTPDGVPVRWIGSITDITERKQTEQEIIALNRDLERRVQERTAELNELNTYNRSLLEASIDPLVTIGVDGRIQDVNESTVNATGVSRDELIGSDFSSYFTEPDRAKTGYEKAFQEGLVRDYPLAIRHRNQGIMPVLYNATVYRDGDGRICGVFAAARDVTNIKKMEGELLDALDLNQKIVTSSPLGIFACRADGPCVFANQAIARISGATLDTMLGLNYLELESWRQNGLRKRVEKVLSTGEDHQETMPVTTTFGRQIWMSYHITRFTRKGMPHFLIISEDVTAQKEAEAAIQAFGAYNRSLIEASLDPLVTIGADGRIQDVNEATIRATGVPRAELIGSDFSSYFTEPDKAKAGYEKVFEEGVVRDYELSIKHREGGIMSVLYNASLYRDEEGQVAGIFAAARDISDKVMAERAMARNTAILDEAGRLARVGGWEIDLKTNELTWTETTYAIHETGTDFKPTLEDGFRFYAPESIPIISRAVKEAMEEGTPFDEELEFITARQNHIWVRAIGKGYREEGKIARVGGVFQDITARRRSEAIKAIQSDLAQLLGGHIDLMGAYSALLEAAVDISGLDCGGIYTLDEKTGCLDLVITRNLSEDFVRHSSHYDPTTPQAMKVMAGEPFYTTLSTLGGDTPGVASPQALAIIPLVESGVVRGCLNVGSFTLDAVPDAAKEPLETLAWRVATVIARIKSDMANTTLNRELSLKTAQLEASNKELEAFSYSVSHDLRAPLRHMTGFIELLGKKEMDGLDEKSRHYLKVVSDSAKRMGCLIDDLLSFSRMGRAEMMRHKVNLKQLAEEVIEEISRDVPADRIIHWRVGDLPIATGDRSMLRLVLVNLISNSVKYSKHTKETLIELDSLAGEPGCSTLYVKDNGVGFDMKYVDKLYGLFQRLHSSEDYEGTGVGLANVRRIIGRHGGSTWAEGELNKGATFYFTLPQEKEI